MDTLPTTHINKVSFFFIFLFDLNKFCRCLLQRFLGSFQRRRGCFQFCRCVAEQRRLPNTAARLDAVETIMPEPRGANDAKNNPCCCRKTGESDNTWMPVLYFTGRRTMRDNNIMSSLEKSVTHNATATDVLCREDVRFFPALKWWPQSSR